MNRKIFIFFSFVFLLLTLFLFARFVREEGGGFRLGKVLLGPALQLQSSEASSEVRAILDQPFYYLDQGCQTYVFQSLDQRYVLKLVRAGRFQPPFWMDWVPLTKHYEKKLSQGRRNNLLNALKSYQLADAYLKKETKILYVHLQQTKDLPTVCLKNRFFQTFEVDLNQVGFLIQKRATPLKEVLLAAKGDAKAKRGIVASFVQLVSSMQEKKIRNRDYNCVKNAGVDGGDVLFLDAGSFAFEEKKLSFPEYEKRMRHFLKHFYRFAQKRDPELLAILDEEIASHLEGKRGEFLK